ncbi:MAG: hypothetical protein ABSF69_28705 [Polyangiaceae bacterium]|jgi:hypothetical protein
MATNTTWKAHLVGPGTRGTRVPAALARDTFGAIVEAVQRAVRLRVEGRSSAQGPVPGWIERASAFDLVAVQGGSTTFLLEANPILDVLPDRQVEMFASFDPRRSCLDLLVESLSEAVAGRADSSLYDDGLLTAFTHFERVFRHGVDAIEVGADELVRIDRTGVETFARLKRETPADQRAVIDGKLDALHHSDRVFRLILESGQPVHGVIGDGIDLEALARLWGQAARVSGVAKFRPSGTILRVDADRIEAASGAPSLWSRLPTPVLRDLDTRKLTVPQGPRSGVAAVWGQWPGDESDEEFLDALAHVS